MEQKQTRMFPLNHSVVNFLILSVNTLLFYLCPSHFKLYGVLWGHSLQHLKITRRSVIGAKRGRARHGLLFVCLSEEFYLTVCLLAWSDPWSLIKYIICVCFLSRPRRFWPRSPTFRRWDFPPCPRKIKLWLIILWLLDTVRRAGLQGGQLISL